MVITPRPITLTFSYTKETHPHSPYVCGFATPGRDVPLGDVPRRPLLWEGGSGRPYYSLFLTRVVWLDVSGEGLGERFPKMGGLLHGGMHVHVVSCGGEFYPPSIGINSCPDCGGGVDITTMGGVNPSPDVPLTLPIVVMSTFPQTSP